MRSFRVTTMANHPHSMRKKFFAFPILVLILFAWASIFAVHKIARWHTATATHYALPGIDSLQAVDLNGQRQWVLMRGQNRANPVLLFLHGGPGAPLFPHARRIGRTTGVEKHFTVVYWEQRGTGKSFSFQLEKNDMSLDLLVRDTVALTDSVRRLFGQDKIFLAGRSFGSLVGILAASRAPHKYHAVIGIAQLVAPLPNDSISLAKTKVLARAAGDAEAIAKLDDLGPAPFAPAALITQRRWLSRLELPEHGKQRPSSWQTRMALLSTPEYSFWDILRMGSDPYFCLEHLWNEALYRIDLRSDVPVIEIPVYFLHGRQDLITAPELVKDYFNRLDAPAGKEMIWFDKCGHDVIRQQPEKIKSFVAALKQRYQFL